jgi:glycerol-3-phosphate acyltransferase PlsY
MPEYILYPLLVIAAYLLGSVPFGWLFAKVLKGVDIRETGSGGIGATNAARVLGTKFFFIVFFLDVAKGVSVVTVGCALDDLSLTALMGAAVIAGHMFSVYLSFRGGKGVAAGVGVFFALLTIPTAISLGVFFILLGVFRYVSLASISGAAAFAGAFFVFHKDANFTTEPVLAVFVLVAAAMIIFKHRSNIKRILAGEEPRIGKAHNA